MVDTVRDAAWLRLLNDKSDDWHWDALFFSAGGNDLIGAMQTRYQDSPDPATRLFLVEAEWDPSLPTPQRYVSEAGWTTFKSHITYWFNQLVLLRDSPKSAAAGSPLFVHTYNFPTPRNAPAAPGVGPWLYPAVLAYGIPPADWNALADEFIGRLGALLMSFTSLPHVLVFDSESVALVRAQTVSGPSGDWENEIHLTHNGYRKLGRPWGAEIGSTLP
jgi:hypothetical protein